MRRFDLLERHLIGAGSLAELVVLLLSEYRLAFCVDFVTLNLLDREQEAARILEGELPADVAAWLHLTQTPDIPVEMFIRDSRPRLGQFDEALLQKLFGPSAGEIASVAILPLIRQNELIGSLHLGSSDPERYLPECGTAFLERLSAIIAVCLQSAFNHERLKLVGLTDGLTGVQNRRYFEHRCQIEISQARRYQHPLACMFLDIDHFKRINDTWGHQSGDHVLAGLASTIQSQLRAGDTIARYGGEEFVVLLPQTSGNNACEIAERIRASIANRQFRSQAGKAISVTISIGLSMLSPSGSNESGEQQASRLVSAADKALYEAKRTGRNRVVCDVRATAGREVRKAVQPGWKVWSNGVWALLEKGRVFLQDGLKRLERV